MAEAGLVVCAQTTTVSYRTHIPSDMRRVSDAVADAAAERINAALADLAA